MPGARLFSTALLVAAFLLPGLARAWVCSRVLDSDGNESGPSLSWAKRDLTYAFNRNGTADLAETDEFDVLRASFAVWSGITECSPPNRKTDILFREALDNPVDHDLIGYDFINPTENENLLVFRDTGWPWSTRIIALTTTTYSAQTGEIIDADIEFNSQTFDFADLPSCCPDCDGNPNNSDPECQATDLSNTAVHEIGHILGLGHPNDWPHIDSTCASGSTMCATAELGEIDKRDLACDDRDAIVFKYPEGEENGYCEVPGCAADLEACGTCSPAVCSDWSDCGYCAPPIPLNNAVTVMAVGFDDGMDVGCHCRASSWEIAWCWLGFAVAWGWRKMREKRRS